MPPSLPRPSVKLLSRFYTSRIPHKVPVNAKFSSELSRKSSGISASTAQSLFIFGVLAWGAVLGLGTHVYIHSEKEEPSVVQQLSTGAPKRASPNLSKAISLLRTMFPEEGRIITDKATLKTYSATNYLAYIGSQDAKAHGVIVFPLSTEDVVKIVKIASQCGVSVVSRGSGTGLEGHTTSASGNSICIDLSRMSSILQVHEQDLDLVCQAGTTWDSINNYLEDKGVNLFFPLDPAPGATLGGMMATGCSGTNAVRYGTARNEWFLNATVVLPSGQVIKTRRRAHKSSSGFDLTQLFIGAEGTLGIVTEVTVRLAPVLPTTVGVAHFLNADQASAAVDEMLKSQYGMHIQCVEFADSRFMEALNHYIKPSQTKPYPLLDSLFIKLQGTPSAIKEAAAMTKSILAKHGCSHLRLANSKAESDEMWRHRREALLAILTYIDGSSAWTTDVCVPVCNLPRLIQQVKDDANAAGIICPIVGHVGDGNFHAALIYRDAKEFKRVQKLSKTIVERALRLDGTCTGEHGVGVGKRCYLEAELGSETVELMRVLKRAIDPTDMMNPGKLYPPVD